MERPQPAVAAAEEAIALYDTYWFHRLVLHSYSPAPAPLPPTPPPPALEQQQQPGQAPAESNRELQRAPTGLRHRRTRSDEAKTATFDTLEPLKIPHAHRARLETILSGKDGLAAPAPQPQPERRRRPGGRRRKQQARGRSLSELEFEEVKGLRDLGFTFSEADVDAELASIVPGLRRLRAAEEKEAKKAEAAAAAACAEEEACRSRAASASASAPRRRPYLSEAWEDEEAEVRRVLSTFRIPAADGGADLKEHLRLWAHNVASAVR